MHFSTAVVTGAASGIGRALATRIGPDASRLVLADIDAAALAATADELGATAVVTDVTDPGAVEALADAAPDAELVCLNAGVAGRAMGPPWEVSPAEWDAVFAVNVGGLVNGLRAFVPRLLASGRPARILITASLAGLPVFAGGGAYGASKHAAVAVAEQAALALAGTNVGVTVLCPALVRTAMSPTGVDPADVAADALVAVRDGRFVVGVPDEWSTAIVQRAERLVSGLPQVPPAPRAAPTPTTGPARG